MWLSLLFKPCSNVVVALRCYGSRAKSGNIPERDQSQPSARDKVVCMLYNTLTCSSMQIQIQIQIQITELGRHQGPM
jgi:hypothetical protein